MYMPHSTGAARGGRVRPVPGSAFICREGACRPCPYTQTLNTQPGFGRRGRVRRELTLKECGKPQTKIPNPNPGGKEMEIGNDFGAPDAPLTKSSTYCLLLLMIILS